MCLFFVFYTHTHCKNKIFFIYLCKGWGETHQVFLTPKQESPPCSYPINVSGINFQIKVVTILSLWVGERFLSGTSLSWVGSCTRDQHPHLFINRWAKEWILLLVLNSVVFLWYKLPTKTTEFSLPCYLIHNLGGRG